MKAHGDIGINEGEGGNPSWQDPDEINVFESEAIALTFCY